MHCIISSPRSALGCFPFRDWHLVIHIAKIQIFFPSLVHWGYLALHVLQIYFRWTSYPKWQHTKISTQDLSMSYVINYTFSFLWNLSPLNSADMFLTKPFAKRSLKEIIRIASYWSGESRYHLCIVCGLLKWRVVLLLEGVNTQSRITLDTDRPFDNTSVT